MKKNDDISPIFSIHDPFVFEPKHLYRFLDVGTAPLGVRHVLVFFMTPNGELDINHANSIKISKYVTVYNLVNKDSTVFGNLFSTKSDKRTTIKRHTLFSGNPSNIGEFELLPYTNEKNNISAYKDDKENVLINISTILDSKFIVLDT